MINMKITFYPNLMDALETLGENEYFYTHSWFKLKIRYKYKKKSKDYEPVSINSSQKPFSYERYEHFLFRKKVVEELIENLISTAENNSEVFKDPLKESITFGLKELYTKIKDKDFICVRSAELLYPRVYVVGRSENINEPILMSMKEEEWKEHFLGFGNIRERFEEEITEKIMKTKGIKPGMNYHGWGEYRWIDVLSVVDKELVNGKGRALARFWEDDRVLGVDKLVNNLLSDWESESVSELKSLLQDNIEKFGPEYAKENLSKMVLGGISLYLSGLLKPEETDAVLIPIKITNENEKGDKEVMFLILARMKIGDRIFSWIPVNINYDAYKAADAIKRGTRKLMRVVDREKIPVEIAKNKEKAILINTALKEEVIISSLGYIKTNTTLTNITVDKIKYKVETEDLKSVRVDIEDIEDLSIKEYREIEGKNIVDEEMVVEMILGGVMKELGCSEEIVDKPMKKKIENLSNELQEKEIKEEDPEKKSGIRLTKTALKRFLNAIEEGRIRKRECLLVGRSAYQNTYRHKIYPDLVLEGEESLIEAIKDFPDPEIAKRAKRNIDILEMDKNKNLCFKSGGLEKKIQAIEGIEEILKEPSILYIKSLSKTLSKMLENRISNVMGVLGELEEINNLSIALSGVVAPAIGKFPSNTEKIEEMAKEVYKLMFKSMVGGEVEHYDYGEDFGWRKENDTLLKWRALIRDMVGIKIRVNISETINVEYYGKKEREDEEKITEIMVKRWTTTSTRKDYGEDLWAVYLDSGYKDKLIEMTVAR